MFRLHALSVDALLRVRRAINRVIVGRERKGYHPAKDASFDILSLADHLYRSRSTHPNGPIVGKVYFSENHVPDLIAEGKFAIIRSAQAYNESILKNQLANKIVDVEELAETPAVDAPLEMPELVGGNEDVNELFFLSTHCS